MWLQGYYSVVSADTGRLSLKIGDQTGTIVATAPMTVAKGGDLDLATIEEPTSKCAQRCIANRR
jgi:hypothetical protein